MALDLTDQFIALTFQRLLQIDPTEPPTGFKPFSLSDAINSDSATLINGVGERINGVVIEQFNQAGLFLKNTNTKFQIYSSTHNSKNGIKFKEYLSNDNVFVTDEGHLYVNYIASYDSSNYSLYVDRGIHLKPISGSAYLKGDTALGVQCQNIRNTSYIGSILNIGPGITNLEATAGLDDGGNYSLPISTNVEPLEVDIIDIPSLSVGSQIILKFKLRNPATLNGIYYIFGGTAEVVDFSYTVTNADSLNPNTFKTNFEQSFNSSSTYVDVDVDVNQNLLIFTPSQFSIMGPPPYQGPGSNANDVFVAQVILPPSNNQQQTNGQVIVELDKDIMDSGVFKRFDTNGNVKCFMIWRRVGNVIQVTGYRQPIPDITPDVDSVELLPVVTQSHVDNGTPVYTYLYGNGVLRDGYNNGAPVPIICKSNDQNGSIASANCAVQFFEYNSNSPIEDVGDGDIRFSFSYDLKN